MKDYKGRILTAQSPHLAYTILVQILAATGILSDIAQISEMEGDGSLPRSYPLKFAKSQRVWEK